MTSETPTRPEPDIVERLRGLVIADDEGVIELQRQEAAAEIERLRGRGGEVPNQPTPPLPEVRCGDCGTVVDLPELAERYIRKQARAAAGWAVAVPEDRGEITDEMVRAAAVALFALTAPERLWHSASALTQAEYRDKATVALRAALGDPTTPSPAEGGS